MPADTRIDIRLTNGDRPARVPGRPYFDPAGAEHLNEALANERAVARTDDMHALHAIGRGRHFDGTAGSEQRALTVLDELRSKIAEATSLYGPGLGASILNFPDDRIEELIEIVEALAADLTNTRQVSNLNATEVRRLEDELAAAQRAHDRAVRDVAVLAGAESHRGLVERYAEGLENEIDRLATKWSSGHGKRVKARAFQRMIDLGPKSDENVGEHADA